MRLIFEPICDGKIIVRNAVTGEHVGEILRIAGFDGSRRIVRGYAATIAGREIKKCLVAELGGARAALCAARRALQDRLDVTTGIVTGAQRDAWLDALDSVLLDAGTDATGVFGRAHAGNMRTQEQLPSSATLIRYMLPRGLSVAEVWRRFEEVLK